MMKVSSSSRGIDGLAARLSARALEPAAEAVASRAAVRLAGLVRSATGVTPAVIGSPLRPVVRVADANVLERVRGTAETAGDPVLDRVRFDFARDQREADTETAS